MKKKMQSLFSLLLAGCMLTAFPTAALTASASDIDGHWAQTTMQEFIDNGWLNGDGTGNYNPNSAMTRAQYAALLNRVMGLTEKSARIADYTDVTADDWYYADFAKALAAGYLSGKTATTLCPNDPITRQEAFVMTANLLGLTATEDDLAALSKFSDVDQLRDYAKSSTAALVAAGYISGNDNGQLQPQKQMTRAEGITLLCNAMAAATGTVPAYDSATLSLKAADGAPDSAVKTYVAAISKVSVQSTATGVTTQYDPKVVTILNESGFVDLNANIGSMYVFGSLEAGSTYDVTVTATGYDDLSFTVTIPETIYAYAALTYAEYWEAENVYLDDAAGGDLEASNTTEADRTYTQGQGDAATTYEEHDKGAFDAVSRATVNHGLHRGSFQQSVEIETSDKTYQPLYWIDGDNFVDVDGNVYNKTEINMTSYEITGIKYVPVAVAAADYQAFCEAYAVTQNGETLSGGYSEVNLNAYQAVACVTADTNGLKTVTRQAQTWSFGARKTGTDSGILNQAQTTAEAVTASVTSSSQFGDFLRVDLTGDGYGALGDMMQTVVWQYYGETDPATEGAAAIATYGTKFAADNWMHKAMGIQLGLTDSLRCQLPEGSDGTGYWTVTVYALGYADYTVTVQVAAGDLHGSLALPMTEAQQTQLTALVDEAGALLPQNYDANTATDAMKALKEHYDEAVALLANADATYAQADELLNELPTLIAAVNA
jgi:hypothetical protein